MEDYIKRSKKWEIDFYKIRRNILYAVAFLVIVAEFVDLLFAEHEQIHYYVNITIAILSMLVVISHYFWKVNVNIGNAIMTYLLTADVLISPHLSMGGENFEIYFLRSAITLGIILVYAGLILGRMHILITASLTVSNFAYILYVSQNEVLLSFSPVLVIMLIGFVGGIYYILYFLEISRKSQSVFIKSITDANTKLDKQKKELDALNKTKDRLFSIIAHDLKNPFNGIILGSELLQESTEERNFEKISEYAELIINNTHEASELLNNLLDWSRLQTKKISIHKKRFNFYTLSEKIIKLFKFSAKAKNIRIVNLVMEEIEINADYYMIDTILRNLVSNAIKFTHEGKVILNAFVNEYNIFMVSVKDTGIGIKDEDVDKLFLWEENFTTFGTNNEVGTGLGLVICNEFIKMHNGRIWVDTTPGEGSSFNFTIQLDNKKITPEQIEEKLDI